MTGPSAVRIALVYPELLGTYGDGGNATVLARRLVWRDIPTEQVPVPVGEPVPGGCDIYLIGGGEDGVQAEVISSLRRGRGLARAVAGQAVVLAVCAGFQVLGHSLPGPDGPVAGLGLLPCRTFRPGPQQPRAVGTVVVEPAAGLDVPPLVGFENHASRTELEPGARPLGTCTAGQANGVPGPDGVTVDGVLHHQVVGSYLHGPLLALNPALADRLLERVVGGLPALPDPEVDRVAEQARQGRLEGVRPRRWLLPAR